MSRQTNLIRQWILVSVDRSNYNKSRPALQVKARFASKYLAYDFKLRSSVLSKNIESVDWRMNVFFGYVTSLVEMAVYGIAYSGLRHLIRTPKPLDPEFAWNATANFRLSPFWEWWRLNYPPTFVRRLLLAHKLRQAHALGIADHYDVSNDFYELFLDKKYMFYSCADFHSEDDTLEDAQTNKADFIVDLLEPHPGEKILDLGCGWGAMLKRVHEATGDKGNLYGYTLSKEQVKYNEENGSFNVEYKNFITCDYVDNDFDKVFSVASWEAVRRPDLPIVLQKLYATLKPGGRMVKHFFCGLEQPKAITTAALVAQIFFPGSLMPSYVEQIQAFKKAGFHITHQSIHDYRPTLRAWFDNLVANRDQAIELVGIATYNKYLIFFGCSHRFFDDLEAILVRFVLEKPDK